MFKQKKASIEVQFNWIYVLVVGALILGFFGALTMQQKKASQSKIDHNMLSQIDAELSGRSASMNTLSRIDSPDSSFQFLYPDYLLNGQRQSLKGRFIFAPSSFSGQYFSTLTKSWNVGADVTNFVYFTNPTIKYYLVADSTNDLAASINSSIEKKIDENSETLIRLDYLLDAQPLDKGYEKTRFVVFDQEPDNGLLTNLANRPDLDVTALKVVKLNPEGTYGELTFYTKRGHTFVPTGNSVYLGKELLYGAIIVDNHYAYSFLFEKAMRKLHILSLIYERRSLLLAQNAPPSCVYPTIIFSDMALAAASVNSNSTNSLATIMSLGQTLSEKKAELELRSCPFPY